MLLWLQLRSSLLRNLRELSPKVTEGARAGTVLFYLKRASNARPYKRILNVLVGATIGRPHKKRCYFVPEHLIRQSPEIPMPQVASPFGFDFASPSP